MRISDWSSDVCSSDLRVGRTRDLARFQRDPLSRRCDEQPRPRAVPGGDGYPVLRCIHVAAKAQPAEGRMIDDIGRRSDRMAVKAHAVIAAIGIPFHHIGPGMEGRGGKRSEEHTSELQSLMRISYAVFCLKKTTQ